MRVDLKCSRTLRYFITHLGFFIASILFALLGALGIIATKICIKLLQTTGDDILQRYNWMNCITSSESIHLSCIRNAGISCHCFVGIRIFSIPFRFDRIFTTLHFISSFIHWNTDAILLFRLVLYMSMLTQMPRKSGLRQVSISLLSFARHTLRDNILQLFCSFVPSSERTLSSQCIICK